MAVRQHANGRKPHFFPPRPPPPYVDLRQSLSPIKDQGISASCSANALATILEYILYRIYGLKIPASRLFIYYNARLEDRRLSAMYDEGAYLGSIINALQKYGCCDERTWPYDMAHVNVKPSYRAYEEARRIIIKPLQVPINLAALRASLANGLPVAIGVHLSKLSVLLSKIHHNNIPVHSPIVSNLVRPELHALVLAGYNDSTQSFMVRNSWGDLWGLGGEFNLPYEWLNMSEFFDNEGGAWTIERVVMRTVGPPNIPMLQVGLHPRRMKDARRRRHKRYP